MSCILRSNLSLAQQVTPFSKIYGRKKTVSFALEKLKKLMRPGDIPKLTDYTYNTHSDRDSKTISKIDIHRVTTRLSATFFLVCRYRPPALNFGRDKKTSLVETNNFEKPKNRVQWPVSSRGRYLHTEKKWPITVSLPYVFMRIFEHSLK